MKPRAEIKRRDPLFHQLHIMNAVKYSSVTVISISVAVSKLTF